MKVTAFFTAMALSTALVTPAFASEHMHVNHDHEHTRYQPAHADQGGTDQNTPAPPPQDSK
ncbi:hypothetical protein [Paraburkholderia sp. SIMBA_030]|uniref:hypothetical protein n=1 Tax=Paraburkholderia sp. SIMBA_030 TaxID=3085773 RepID=UPI00397A6822